MSSEPIISSSYTIQYHVTQQSVATRIKHILHIWELVPNASGRDNLLYQINYEVQGESGAHRIINHLLGAAGAQQLSAYQFEKLQGKLKVNPNPTLRLPTSQIPRQQ